MNQDPNQGVGHRIYAVGDIHGSVHSLSQLHRLIGEHHQRSPAESVTLVYLGDYIDKGPDSKAVLELLIDSPLFEHRVCLMGNHEYLLNHFLLTGLGYQQWLQWGGGQTLLSYGLEPISDDSNSEDQRRFRDVLLDRIPATHLAFLAQTKPYYRYQEFLFVHAGIRPGIPLERQCTEDLVFIREDFLSSEEQREFKVVHGHTPTNQPDIKSNRIGIDTKAYITGQLTAAVIDGSGISFLSTECS